MKTQHEELHRLQLIARHASNAVIITDTAGYTTWGNAQIERLTGYSAEELKNCKPGALLQGPETDSDSVQTMRRAVRACKPFDVTVANYTKAGQLYWVQIACQPFHDDDGALKGFISTQVDVTSLRRLSEFNNMHAAVNQVIANSGKDLALIQAVCDLAVRHAHLELAWIGRPDPEGRFVFLAYSGGASAYLDGFMISVDPSIREGQGPSGMTWRTGRPHYSESFATTKSLSPWQKRARHYGLDASATLPIFRNGQIWAVFSVYHTRSDVFDKDLRNVLDTLARDISNGLDQIDIRARERNLSEQLYQEKQLAQFTLASIEDAVATTDTDARILTLNPKARDLTGWRMHEALGVPANDVLRFVDVTTGEPREDPILQVLSSRNTISFGNNTLLVARDRSTRHVESAASPIFTQENGLKGCVIVFRDVTQRYALTQQLEWQANHDPLTKLPNRFALEHQLKTCIAKAKITGKRVAVGFIDLDDFKPVNDHYGHEAGDVLIKELSRRLKARLREGDFLARLAGDELVVVVDALEAEGLDLVLEAVLARLHEAVEEPFVLMPDERVSLDMSMGVSIYPQDADDVDGLIRQADAAMYMAKENKYSRSKWWRNAAFSLTHHSVHEPLDPYGAAASELLLKTVQAWRGLHEEFVEAFYAGLFERPTTERVLSLLDQGELKRLKDKQTDHLLRLTSPDLDRITHQTVASKLGEIHAMVGVESSDIIAAMEEYGRLLRYACQKLPWRIDARLALDSIMQSRLAAEIQYQSKGRDQVDRDRIGNLAGLEREMKDWLEEGAFAERLCRHLAQMPCICAAVIGRPDSGDHFVLEFEEGQTQNVRALLAEETTARDGRNDLGFGWQRAWVTGQLQITDLSPKVSAALTMNEATGGRDIRSAAYIAILDTQGHTNAIVALFGSYPGQFSQVPMRMWLESVQHIVTPAFQRLEKSGGENPIDTQTRERLHALLFGDGVQVVVQPIVSLITGQIEKAEMLARLYDGKSLLPPAAFLPAFGKQDLQALFRIVLNQSMLWLDAWNHQGLRLDVNVNVPPSVLVSPDCVQWVVDALNAHAIEPSRLYLELLETEDDTGLSSRRDETIAKLAKMGVRLVMDDLGSGYSSLHRMRLLPFHSVKVDQGLVQDAMSDPERNVPFVGSLVRTAQVLGLEVVIEGLETLDMVDMAARLKAEYGQGYALSKPMLPNELVQWAQKWHATFSIDQLNTPLGDFAKTFLSV